MRMYLCTYTTIDPSRFIRPISRELYVPLHAPAIVKEDAEIEWFTQEDNRIYVVWVTPRSSLLASVRLGREWEQIIFDCFNSVVYLMNMNTTFHLSSK